MPFNSDLQTILATCSAPGFLGGIAIYTYSVKKGLYKNNRFAIKLATELVGATVVASALGPCLPKATQIVASFGLGLAWVSVIQVVRSRITRMVEAVLSK